MLSGIGDRQELEQHGIPVVKHSPEVGKNLQDHPMIFNKWVVDSPETWDTIQRDPEVGGAAKAAYDANATGPLSNALAQMIGFFRLPASAPIWSVPGVVDQSPGPNSPQYEFIFADGFAGIVDAIPTEGPEATANFFTVGTMNLTPSSRGSILLKSADPFDAAVINVNLMSTELDIVTAIAAIKKARELMSLPVYKTHVIREWGTLSAANTDEELREYIRQQSFVGWHGTSSVALSAIGSSTGVLNPDLRVKGVKGIRVIDGSIFPYVPAAHPVIPIFIAGEVGAAMILEHYAS